MNIKDIVITSLKTEGGLLYAMLSDGTQWECPLSLVAAALADIGPSGQKAIKITFPVVQRLVTGTGADAMSGIIEDVTRNNPRGGSNQ